MLVGILIIVKYIGDDFQVTIGNDVQTLILIKRLSNSESFNVIHNQHKNTFIYFNSDTLEYNIIVLFNNEQDFITKNVDSVQSYIKYNNDQTINYPLFVIENDFGPIDEFQVQFRPIVVEDILIKQMRTSLYLGNLRYLNENFFDQISKDTLEKFNDIYDTYNVDNIFETYPENVDTDEEFILYLNENYGITLNIYDNDISQMIPFGLDFYEDDLKQVIIESKNKNFTDDFFSALESINIILDRTYFTP